MASSHPDLSAAVASPNAAWEVALDRVELDLVRAERAIETGRDLDLIDEWRVPDTSGRMPAALRPWAEEILARQRAALRRMVEQLEATAQLQAIVEAAAPHSAHSPGPGVYVDVSA